MPVRRDAAAATASLRKQVFRQDGCGDGGDSIAVLREDGRGSLEPGVASGEEFIMAYPLPFLEHYYFENRSELPDALRAQIFPVETVESDHEKCVRLKCCPSLRAPTDARETPVFVNSSSNSPPEP
eukprot:CAMPEP_0183357408 /NCGR_PEP_ID=MMETSP0164_2-20130417/46190_1 /TAXON_ID=221442 /ORGANISM="Coccolithus pelagicus ssp braarudi, Strain PLY182g" /LENGTH=125 /DNA_ID=CAMNT_0025531011 /DNA_START=552 /DNA_END=925 /DNA_ORIENTATION=-